MNSIKAFAPNILSFLLLGLFPTLGFGQLPESLTSARSAVAVEMPYALKNGFEARVDWKKFAREAHASLRQIGVDPIVYLYKDDLTAGPEITKSYTAMLQQREIKHLIMLSTVGDGYDLTYLLKIYLTKNGLDLNAPFYEISATSVRDLMLVLGRQVLRQDIERSNFLIPEQPEFLDDLPLYDGTRYENVPTRLQSMKLAVAKFDTLTISQDASEMSRNKILSANALTAQKNKQLAKIMERYPFKYELVDYTTSQDLYKRGFQYVLMPLISSGRTIKQMLNYTTTPSETIYISEIRRKGEKAELKKIPADANMTKYYVKQTILMDMHVGKVWDADVTWQQALDHFLTNLMFDLN